MFNDERALHAIHFIERLSHTKGKWRGKPFDLLPWQDEIIKDVYGTLNEEGNRQYQYCYLETPKKQGKSELGAAIGLYHAFADGEYCGEVYGCAADRANASQVFDVAVEMIGLCPSLKKRCKLTISQKTIVDKVSRSFYKVLSSEAYSKHGFNVSACIFDELHAQPTRDLWDVMTTYAGDAREQPLWYVITTAGNDPDRASIGWEIHEKARKIINGEIIDPRWYCKIWGIEPDFEGDIFDEKLWYLTNPSLGHTVKIEKVRQAAAAAKESEAEERLFRWLRLNQWISVKQMGWLPLTLWDATESKDWSPEDMVGKRCYVGIDLSSTTDITAVVILFPPGDGCREWRFITKAWVPEAGILERSRRDHVPYDKWVREKHLNSTPGGVVDYGLMAAELAALEKRYRVERYFSDPWHMEYLRQLLPMEMQQKFVEIAQNMNGMSCGMNELDRMFRAKEITHLHDPLGRWSFGNVRVAMDGNENKKPMKNKSIERIDPTVALVNAMAGAIRVEPAKSVYEARGIRMV